MLKPTVHYRSDTKGFEKLVANLRELGAEAVEVGIFAESGEEVVLRAAVNENGTEDGRVPARPFASTAFVVRREELVTTSGRVLAAATRGKMTPDRALNLLGMKGQALMRQRIVEIDTPPNAPRTIAAKGSDNPLIDTGEMLREIDYRVRKP